MGVNLTLVTNKYTSMIRHTVGLVVSCLLLGSARSYSCWNCTCSGTECGSGSNADSYCQIVTNSSGTIKINSVNGPTSIGNSQVALQELCQIQATYLMGPTDSDTGLTPGTFQSISRGVAWFQAENAFEHDQSMNRTGTFCSLSGGYLTCTYICYGNDCNDLTNINSIPGNYYNCYGCKGSNLDNTAFQNCLNQP